MRTGTRTEIKRRGTPQGHRPHIRIKLGYEFTYLYAALAPKSGRLIALLLPDMTADSFTIFLNYFEQQVDHRAGKTLLIVDQASAHQHRGSKNSKVVIKYLPVASPELNCVERFFEELRKPLSNHIFKTINEVERLVCRV